MSTVPDWLPGVTRIQNTSDAGPMLPGSKWSLLLHTAEGGGVQQVVSALRGKSAWSHFVYDPDTDQLVQCVSLNRAAKSLRSGGNLGKTNAARVIQVEICGFAREAPNWSPERNARIGRMIARIQEHVPFRLDMPLTFYGDRAGFIVASKTAKQRMSWPGWYRFDAICGHQHAPANDHWDPGAINTSQILLAASNAAHANPSPPEPQKGPLMALTDAEQTELLATVRDLKKGQASILVRTKVALEILGKQAKMSAADIAKRVTELAKS